MGTVSTNEFRKKLKIMVDGQPYEIIENQFVKPGKGQAFNRVRIKNLVTGRTLERTWKSGDTVEEADVTFTEMTYLYNDGSTWYFLNNETQETEEIAKENLNGCEVWLLDGATVEVTWWKGKLKKSPRKPSMAAKFGSSMALLSKSPGGRTRRLRQRFRSK